MLNEPFLDGIYCFQKTPALDGHQQGNAVSKFTAAVTNAATSGVCIPKQTKGITVPADVHGAADVLTPLVNCFAQFRSDIFI